MPVLLRAGELAARGQADLWRASDYAEADEHDSAPRAVPCRVRGLERHLADPYEYPPPFAVLPRAGLAITDDYEILRAAWFGVCAVAFWLAYAALALRIRGHAGAGAMLLAPGVAIASPLMFGLQWGQAHLLVLAAAVGGMLALARGRLAAGGLLLGFATLTKLFPGLLLVHLAVRRQWRELGAALVAIAALSGLAALVLGGSTLVAFVTAQLPRIASGEAFAFTASDPGNYAPYGLVYKLQALGIGSADPCVASLLAWIWGVVALVLAALASRGRLAPDRAAVVWLGILCAATLRSPYAPLYTGIGSVWLLAVVASPRAGRPDDAPPRWPWRTAAIAVAWLLLQGYPPVFSREVNTLASLPSQIVSLALAVAALWPRRAPAAPADAAAVSR